VRLLTVKTATHHIHPPPNGLEKGKEKEKIIVIQQSSQKFVGTEFKHTLSLSTLQRVLFHITKEEETLIHIIITVNLIVGNVDLTSTMFSFV
jgi:tryptophanase